MPLADSSRVVDKGLNTEHRRDAYNSYDHPRPIQRTHVMPKRSRNDADRKDTDETESVGYP